ncbi:MAG: alanine--tRNA ligase [Tepidisphaerales bacterium]
MASRLTSAQVRQGFIDFFVARHGHTFVPSSPVVPLDDPTLLFTNAGMNQFKPVFLGLEKRPYTRAVNTQKCIRAGGKHNDLDDVGRSRRHHTFFEMLGNWSFGDYFKQGAIEMSWELLTEVWGLDPRRLHVTCFEGDEKAGVPRDTEAAEIWKQVGNWERYGLRSEDHIHFFGAKDNFWEMGETGPCGPCTEISIDRRPQAEIDAERAAGKRAPVNGDDPRVMEVWNNVFIQFNRNPDRSLTPLPAKHVDTGMGLERIIQVLQGVDSNYEIDLFDPYWQALEKLSGHRYSARYPRTNAADPAAEAADPDLRRDIAYRVIADHIRCLTFALTDGAAPGNEGRGYVLRRILRRAVRFGRQQLDLREPFLHRLVDVVVGSMGDAFPELKTNPRRVADLIRDEEVSFGRTLDRGLQLFEEAVAGRREVPAEAAFKLHDTYGFPIDLTRIMAEERGLTVDLEGYERLMEQARQLARGGGKADASPVQQLPPDALDELSRRGVPATDDRPKYTHEPVQATVLAIWNGTTLASEAVGGDVALILDRTPFYAEMGGQVGDTGTVGPLHVTATRAAGPYILHIGTLTPGQTLRVGDKVTAAVGRDRPSTEKNHTATHLANWALREVLGGEVQQKGSLVDPEKLRFDFSHGKAMELPEVEAVERHVLEQVRADLRVYAEEAPQEQALKINGLRAVFGEKYPPRVRVVSIGVPVGDLLARPDDPRWRRYSIEFCGGTHLASTRQVEDFVITEESAVAKGIRRIVALTGSAAVDARRAAAALEQALTAGDLAAVQKALAAPNLPLLAKRRGQARLAELQAQAKAAEKAQKSAVKLDTAAVAADLLAHATPLGGGKLVVAAIDHADDDALRGVIDSLRKRQSSLAVLLAAVTGDRISFCAAVSDDLIARGLKAGDWVREAARVAGGGGGGKPNMAQAGGKDPAKLPDALDAARAYATRTVA